MSCPSLKDGEAIILKSCFMDSHKPRKQAKNSYRETARLSIPLKSTELLSSMQLSILEKGMTENEMVGWHHHLNGHEFEQAAGDSEGQGNLACCSPWRHREPDTTERPNSSVSVRHLTS